jgi:NAD(P)-dependent dehydrogenase (short-subunit alcohol dehydrogenase family)
MRRVLLAGATSDLGIELAQGLSRKGYELILLGRDEEKLKRLGFLLEGPSKHHKIDISGSPERLADFITEVSDNANGVYAMVSLLGHIKPEPLRTAKLGSWIESMNVNLFANVELIRGFAKSVDSTGGTRRIIMLSSVASTRGDVGLAPYAASKAALESLVRSAALELAPKKISVNTIRLGLLGLGMGEDIHSKIGTSSFSVLAKRYPLGIGVGSELLGAVLFMLEEDSLWMTGSVINLDGGYSIT